MTLSRYFVKRSAIFAGTLLGATLIIVVLAHSALDDIQRHAIKQECNDEATRMKFKDLQTRIDWIENCIQTKEKAGDIYQR